MVRANESANRKLYEALADAPAGLLDTVRRRAEVDAVFRRFVEELDEAGIEHDFSGILQAMREWENVT